MANLQLNAGNNSSEKVLSGKTDNDSDDARTREKALELGFSVIAEAEDKQKSDEENQQGKDLAQNVRNGRLPLLFEVEVPQVPVNECDDDDSACQDEQRGDVMLQLHRQPVRPDGGVKGRGDTKQLEEHTETHTRPPLEKTADGECEKERHEKNKNRDRGSLRLGQSGEHCRYDNSALRFGTSLVGGARKDGPRRP